MKRILTILLMLALFCQAGYSQESNENLIKSIFLEIDTSEISLHNNRAGNFLNTLFNIPNDYEFRNQTREIDGLACVQERYDQYYRGIKIEHSDNVMTFRQPNNNVTFTSSDFTNGAYGDVVAKQNITTSGSVNVTSGSTLHMTAGNSIKLLPGFKAEYGSFFSAKIANITDCGSKGSTIINRISKYAWTKSKYNIISTKSADRYLHTSNTHF